MQEQDLMTDSCLIKALKNEDKQAFQTLYDLHWKDLYKTAYARFRDKQDAEDSVQDIFIKIWEIRHTLEITSSLKAYLQTALKFKIIRVLSRADLHQKTMEHLVYRMTEMQATILDVMAASDLERTLSQAVGQFPENMQKIFILRSEDYTVREIAEALGLAEQTVRNNVAESLRRLKVALAKTNPEVSTTLAVVLTALMVNTK